MAEKDLNKFVDSLVARRAEKKGFSPDELDINRFAGRGILKDMVEV